MVKRLPGRINLADTSWIKSCMTKRTRLSFEVWNGQISNQSLEWLAPGLWRRWNTPQRWWLQLATDWWESFPRPDSGRKTESLKTAYYTIIESRTTGNPWSSRVRGSMRWCDETKKIAPTRVALNLELMATWLQCITRTVWNIKTLPQDWRNALLLRSAHLLEAERNKPHWHCW